MPFTLGWKTMTSIKIYSFTTTIEIAFSPLSRFQQRSQQIRAFLLALTESQFVETLESGHSVTTWCSKHLWTPILKENGYKPKTTRNEQTIQSQQTDQSHTNIFWAMTLSTVPPPVHLWEWVSPTPHFCVAEAFGKRHTPPSTSHHMLYPTMLREYCHLHKVTLASFPVAPASNPLGFPHGTLGPCQLSHNSAWPVRVLKNGLVCRTFLNTVYSPVQLHPLPEVSAVLTTANTILTPIMFVTWVCWVEPMAQMCWIPLPTFIFSIFILPLPGAWEVLEHRQEWRVLPLRLSLVSHTPWEKQDLLRTSTAPKEHLLWLSTQEHWKPSMISPPLTLAWTPSF